MLFIIRFTDDPERMPVRAQYLEAHIQWLAQRKDAIRVAGSLRTAEGVAPIGALWIVEASSIEAAGDMYKTDPFWVKGLRKEVEVLHWSKAFAEPRVLV